MRLVQKNCWDKNVYIEVYVIFNEKNIIILKNWCHSGAYSSATDFHAGGLEFNSWLGIFYE